LLAGNDRCSAVTAKTSALRHHGAWPARCSRPEAKMSHDKVNVAVLPFLPHWETAVTRGVPPQAGWMHFQGDGNQFQLSISFGENGMS